MEQKDASGDRERYANMTREERLQQFKRTIAHPHLKAVSQTCCEVLREPCGASCVLVCGPVGVGKTTMKDHIIRAIVTEILSSCNEDKERIPILSTFARPPFNDAFSWNDFLQNSLSALEQPLIDRESVSNAVDEENISPTQSSKHQNQHRPLKRTKKDTLRISLETGIRRHRPVAVIVDDAHYLGKVSGIRQLQNRVDSISALAESTKTVHVLIGTYELLPLRNISAQFIRRSLIIHFPRYRDTDQELSQFKRVLSAFQKSLPFAEETDILLKHWEFCYERSLGCIGILHTMLLRAVHAALQADEKTLNQKYLEKYALSKTECCAMMREISEGERELSLYSQNYDRY